MAKPEWTWKSQIEHEKLFIVCRTKRGASTCGVLAEPKTASRNLS